MLIEYQSFKALKAAKEIYYPYLLKEHRNRWFLVTMRKKYPYIITLALDRMIEFQPLTKEPYVEYEGVDFERYFDDLIGVTKSQRDRPQKVILAFDKVNAPYVITKPLHSSQQWLSENEDGIIIRIDVVLNFELEKEILGFGECVKVVSPRNLQARIKRRIDNAAKHYGE